MMEIITTKQAFCVAKSQKILKKTKKKPNRKQRIELQTIKSMDKQQRIIKLQLPLIQISKQSHALK